MSGRRRGQAASRAQALRAALGGTLAEPFAVPRLTHFQVTVGHVGSDRKFPICNDPKFLTLGLSLKAVPGRSVGFANRCGISRK